MRIKKIMGWFVALYIFVGVAHFLALLFVPGWDFWNKDGPAARVAILLALLLLPAGFCAGVWADWEEEEKL